MNFKQRKKEIDKEIRKALFLAWEAGKKQIKTPYEYTLDTDKIGQPLYDFFSQLLSDYKKELEERIWNLDNPFMHDYDPKSKKQYDPDAWHNWEACKEQVVSLLQKDKENKE